MNIFDPSTHPDIRELATPTAVKYCELGLILVDLEACRQALEFWLQHRENDDPLVGNILFRDTALVLAELFCEGALDEHEVLGDDQDAHIYLKCFRDIRVSFAAHRFGSGRGAFTAIHIGGGDGDPEAIGVSYFTYVVPIHQPFGAGEAVFEFIEIVSDFVSKKLDALNAEVLTEAKAMTSAELLALPKGKHRLPNLSDITRTRREMRTGAPSLRGRRGTRGRASIAPAGKASGEDGSGR